MKQVKKTTTDSVLLKVTDNDENCEVSAEHALVVFTPQLKALILKARSELMRLKKELDSATYDVRIFNYHPKFIAYGQIENITDGEGDVLQTIDKTGRAFIPVKFGAVVEEIAETVRTDVELLHITDHSFFWSGYYKHTDIRYTTEGMGYDELESMNIKKS
jgi:hypothetical protein